jgi:hypothetical protein
MGDGVLLDPLRVARERGGVLLDSRGRPKIDRTAHRPQVWTTLHEYENPNFDEQVALASAPPHVLENLRKAEEVGAFGPTAEENWQRTIRRLDSDGAQVLNTVTETIMLPDFTLPWDYCYGGRQLKWVLWGRVSTVVTTPGTITFRARYGATGIGGAVVTASKAQRPKVTVSTNMAALVEFITHFRRAGASGFAIGMGSCLMGNTIGDAQAAGEQVWPDAPAEVAVDTTGLKVLAPTVQFSVATATTAWTTHIARLESLT